MFIYKKRQSFNAKFYFVLFWLDLIICCEVVNNLVNYKLLCQVKFFSILGPQDLWNEYLRKEFIELLKLEVIEVLISIYDETFRIISLESLCV